VSTVDVTAPMVVDGAMRVATVGDTVSIVVDGAMLMATVEDVVSPTQAARTTARAAKTIHLTNLGVS
jgi:hypothetical protein